MRLAQHRQLDLLIGEYLLGTLRGGARRRFERALRDEPAVALRLRALQQQYSPRYGEAIATEPPAAGWQRLERELNLKEHRAPWYARATVLRAWAFGATAALVVALALLVHRAPTEMALAPIAQLAAKGAAPSVTAQLSRDGATLRLVADRPIVAGPLQSYELWLIPPGAAPVSLAVLGAVDATLQVPKPLIGQLRPGAQLAISVEPAGGSPTGAPTGPVILAGAITS